MTRTLIVARLAPGHTQDVAELFAASDATDLPHRLGVHRRTLFTFHDLYFHLVEADGEVRDRLGQVRDDPHWIALNADLAQHIQPYDPQTWRSPGDAMAKPFYQWSPR